jgi:hydroxymethylglutaryl-CoA synthase
MSAGILATGSYLPLHRLSRATIAQALGSGSSSGTRSVASYDEDATTLGVEAARAAVAHAAAADISSLWFTTTVPAYADKTNATAIHAALSLPQTVPAYDCVGSVRSFCGALLMALRSGTEGGQLVVAGDLRGGLPGSADERNGGDAGAAVLVGDQPGTIATFLGHGSATAEFLERWRAPGEAAGHSWEDRFGEFVYEPLALNAVAQALEVAELKVDQLDHVIIGGLPARAAKRVARSLGVTAPILGDDLAASVGNTGAAHPALMLDAVLRSAEPRERIALVVLADGADCFLFEVTPSILRYRAAGTSSHRVATVDLPYLKYLTWRDQLRREPPRRPDPDMPVPPSTLRERLWKFGFSASRCTVCAAVHMPPNRVCATCGSVDQFLLEPMSSRTGTIVTVTEDHLAFTLDSPMRIAVVDFAGGGRIQCELTDVGTTLLAKGDEVVMTFRRAYTAGTVHNYVWKARPISAAGGTDNG